MEPGSASRRWILSRTRQHFGMSGGTDAISRLPLISTTGSSFGDACWTADGRYFVYTETSQRASRLWIRREIGAAGQERPALLNEYSHPL